MASCEIYYIPEKNIWLIEQEVDGFVTYYYLKNFEIYELDSIDKQSGLFTYYSKDQKAQKYIDFKNRNIKELDAPDNIFNGLMDSTGNYYFRYLWDESNKENVPEKWNVTLDKSFYTQRGRAFSLFKIEKENLSGFLDLYNPKIVGKF